MADNWNIYLKGKKYLRQPAIARKFFEESYSFNNMRYKSLLQLISLDLKEGNFKSARELIEKHLDEYRCDNKFNILYGYLEHDEYNFHREKSILYQSLNEKNYEVTLKHLADIDLQFGKYDEAYDKYYELLGKKGFLSKAVFKVVVIKMLTGDYDGAEDVLDLLELEKLTHADLCLYQDFRCYIKYFKGQLSLNNISKTKKKYRLFRLICTKCG